MKKNVQNPAYTRRNSIQKKCENKTEHNNNKIHKIR